MKINALRSIACCLTAAWVATRTVAPGAVFPTWYEPDAPSLGRSSEDGDRHKRNEANHDRPDPGVSRRHCRVYWTPEDDDKARYAFIRNVLSRFDYAVPLIQRTYQRALWGRQRIHFTQVFDEAMRALDLARLGSA